MPTLTSAQYKELKSLRTKKGRSERGSFLIEGEKGIEEAMRAGWPLVRIVTVPSMEGQYLQAGVPVLTTDGEHMASISGVETAPGVIAEALIPENQEIEWKGDSVLICCGIADPGNLGTIIRTADWFGVETVLVSEDSVDPFNEKVVRSSMGSFFRVTVQRIGAIEEQLKRAKSKGYAVITTSVTGEGISWPSQPICLLLGSESHGVSEDINRLADGTVSIPSYGKAESLNVGVACGVLLQDLRASTRV